MFFEDLLRAARRRWAVPVVSAGLIVAALAARQLDPAAGHLLMVVAAVVAGARTATRAPARVADRHRRDRVLARHRGRRRRGGDR